MWRDTQIARADRSARGPRASLALGVLRAAAGLATPDLLALDLAGVARHETGIAQRLAQRLIVLDERAGDAVTDGAGLAGDAAAVAP